MAPSKQQRLSLPLLLGAFLFAAALTALWTYSTDALQQAIPGPVRPAGARPSSLAPAASATRISVTTAVSAPTPADAVAPSPLAAADDPPAAPEVQPAGSTRVRIRGHVADKAGPVAGVFKVAIYGLPKALPQRYVLRTRQQRTLRERARGLPGFGRAVVLAIGRSAANGEFQLDVELGGQDRALAAVVSSSTDPGLLGATRRIHKAGNVELDFEAVPLDPVIRIRVAVTEQGRPVPNARVSFGLDEGYGQRREEHTDRNGMAQFAYAATLSGVGRVEVLVEAEGLASWSDTLDTSRLSELKVELLAGHAVHGRVSDPTGAPLPNVSVRARPTDKAAKHVAEVEAVTDPTGRFVLEGVAEAQAYTVRTHERSGDYLGTATSLAPPFAELELRMARAGRIGVTVEADRPEFKYDQLGFLVERLRDGRWEREFDSANRLDHFELHGEDPVHPSPASRYFEYRWIAPGDYRVRGVGGRLRTTAQFTVLAGETALATVHAAPLRTVRLLFPKVTGEFVDVVYTFSDGSAEADSVVRDGVLVLSPPPAARSCTVKTWEHKPLQVELPAGVDELGPFTLDPIAEGD